MTFDPPSLPAAGWYDDPHRAGAQRWWNGAIWEDAWSGIPEGELPDIGGWLNDSFSNAFARWRAVTTVALITGLPGSILLTVGLGRLVEGVLITDDDVTGWSNDRLPLAITLLLVSAFLTALGVIAVTAMMLRTVDGDTAGETNDEIRSGVAAITDAVRILPRAIGWLLVLMAAVMAVVAVIVVLFLVAAALGVIAVLVLVPAAVYFGVGLAFVTQSIVDRPGQPFGRSIATSRGQWWAVFGRILLIGVITWLMSAVLQGVSAVASGGGFGSTFGQTQFEIDSDGSFTSVDLADVFSTSAWAIAVGAVVAVVLTVCVTSVSSAAFARLYRTRNPAE